jgi:hypothetical protein
MEHSDFWNFQMGAGQLPLRREGIAISSHGFLNGPLWNNSPVKERATPGARLPEVISCQEHGCAR